MTYKTYRRQRYAFFWLSVLAYFVPYIVATCCLLPVMRTDTGLKWGVGLAVIAINALPFLGGIFRGVLAHFPFVNVLAIVFIMLAAFFTLDLFSNYVYTFLTIEGTAAAGSIAACWLWYYHMKYKRKSQTVSDIAKSGILGG
jgi:hypothetical protein